MCNACLGVHMQCAHRGACTMRMWGCTCNACMGAAHTMCVWGCTCGRCTCNVRVGGACAKVCEGVSLHLFSFCGGVSLQLIRLHGGVSLQLLRLHGGVSFQLIRFHRGVSLQLIVEVYRGVTSINQVVQRGVTPINYVGQYQWSHWLWWGPLAYEIHAWRCGGVCIIVCPWLPLVAPSNHWFSGW